VPSFNPFVNGLRPGVCFLAPNGLAPGDHGDIRRANPTKGHFLGSHTLGNLPLTFLDSYELKSRKVDEEHRIRKKLIPKLIFRRSEAQKNPLFFRKGDK